MPWALGMAYHFSGESERALAAHEQALALNARSARSLGRVLVPASTWRSIELEERRFAAARARCRAAGAGRGQARRRQRRRRSATRSHALAATGSTSPAPPPRSRLRCAGLRDIDAKSLLAWTRNAAAEIDLAAGRFARARAHAAAARVVAVAVERPSEVALADALAARAAAAAGDAAAAAQHAAALDDVDPAILSARARRHVAAALAHRRSPG